MTEIVPYELEEIKNKLKLIALKDFDITDAQYEGSNISQLINLISYASMANNINLAYSANETNLISATQFNNVVKKAKELGYIYKLNTSYQYTIKLECIDFGLQTILKYSIFTDSKNQYIYLGSDIIDNYGVIIELESTSDFEVGDIVSDINDNSIKVLEITDKTLLIDFNIEEYSTDRKEILVLKDGDFISLGEIETFLSDNSYKIQFNYNLYEFYETFSKIETKTINNNKISLSESIFTIESISVDGLLIPLETLVNNNNTNTIIFNSNYNNKEAIITYRYNVLPDIYISDTYISDENLNLRGFSPTHFDINLNLLEFHLDSKLDETLTNIFKKNRIIYNNKEYIIKNKIMSNTLTLDVKEGVLDRYEDNPSYNFIFTEAIQKKGYFSIEKKGLENDGLELFINGVRFKKQESLLMENIDKKSFIVEPESDWNDIYKVYTKYADLGYDIPLDSKISINMLTSKGKEGSTTELLKFDNPSFNVVSYNESYNNLLIVEGSNIEGKEEIRKNAILVNNTANRAVTALDYKVICNQQAYIKDTKVWGGEEEVPLDIPGHIFFSTIPNSQTFVFNKKDYKFTRDKSLIDGLFYNTYNQITGKNNYYDIADKTDNNVLFNVLAEYAIITLKHNYIKPIYANFNITVELINRNRDKSYNSYIEIMKEAILSYFLTNIEMYDFSYYKSSLIKYIDRTIGDDYGITLKNEISVELIDDVLFPSNSSFINKTLNDLNHIDNKDKGYTDIFEFKMNLSYIGDLFTNDTLNFKYLTNCNTMNFIVENDILYLEPDIEKYTSLKNVYLLNTVRDLTIENNIPDRLTDVINIPIIYKPNKDENIKFTIGYYSIYRVKKKIQFVINISNINNINNTNNEIDIKTDSIICNLPREYFVKKRKLILNTYTDSFKSQLNTFGLLNSIEFKIL